jgi:hypothetical protein
MSIDIHNIRGLFWRLTMRLGDNKMKDHKLQKMEDLKCIPTRRQTLTTRAFTSRYVPSHLLTAVHHRCRGLPYERYGCMCLWPLRASSVLPNYGPFLRSISTDQSLGFWYTTAVIYWLQFGKTNTVPVLRDARTSPTAERLATMATYLSRICAGASLPQLQGVSRR